MMTRFDVAAQLLSAASVPSLRRETRRNREWVAIYRGFRPDSLTRPLFVRGAVAFAASPHRLASLCEVFLDSIGVPKQPSLSGRFAAAAELTELDPQVADVCRQLASIQLADLPVGSPDLRLASGKTVDPEEAPEAPEAPDSELLSGLDKVGSQRKTRTPKKKA